MRYLVKLTKAGGRLVHHARQTIFRLAEVVVPRYLVAPSPGKMLDLDQFAGGQINTPLICSRVATSRGTHPSYRTLFLGHGTDFPNAPYSSKLGSYGPAKPYYNNVGRNYV